jgi:hypothetical protein
LDTTGIRDYVASLLRQEAHSITTSLPDERSGHAHARVNDLRGLADEVQRLPDDDERLVRLAKCWYPEGPDGPPRVSANVNQVIRGYDTDGDIIELGGLLDRIAELDEQERAG